MELIVGTISLFMLVTGAALAIASEKHTARAELMEYTGGALIVGGLALIGAGMACSLTL